MILDDINICLLRVHHLLPFLICISWYSNDVMEKFDFSESSQIITNDLFDVLMFLIHLNDHSHTYKFLTCLAAAGLIT